MAESDLRRPDATVFPFQAAPGLDFPEYATLREEDPVALVRLATGGRAYLVTRYEDVRRVLADPVFGRAALSRPGAAVLLQGSRIPYVLTNMDPPDHTRIRKLVAKAFTVRGVEPLRPRAQEIADGIQHCIGAALARLELETALTTLLRRLPHLRPAQPPETLDWKAGVTSVGPSALPVTW